MNNKTKICWLAFALLCLLFFQRDFQTQRIGGEEPAYYSQMFLTARNLPPQPKVVNKVLASLSGYSSTVEETDSTPFITASGEKVREGIVASNWLDFGEMIEIEGEILEVQDRMNSRYGFPYLDIWFPDKKSAIEFGRKVVEIKILK